MKNKLIFLAVLFILIINVSLVYSEPIDYGKSLIKVSLLSGINSDKPVNLAINLTSIPLEDIRQRIVSKKIIPNSDVNEISGAYVYKAYGQTDFIFGWNASFETMLYLYDIQEKSFPLKISGFSDYTKETDSVDLTSDIIKTANEIVSGKNSLNSAILALAEFVNSNMTYDKSLVGKNKQASWILENKRGVCSQYATLLMALLRSIGIPTRYVSGVAYSNIDNNFGSHAWIEFYNGDIWIPLDPTYGEYFYLDSSHVAFSKSMNIESGIYVSYTPSSNLQINEVKILAESQKIGDSDYNFDIQIEPYKSQFAPKSYIPVKITVKNNYDFLAPLQLSLIKAPGVYGKNSKTLLVPAKSSASIYFILQIPAGESEYLYTTNMEVKDQFGDSAENALEFSDNYDFVSLEKALDIVKSAQEGEKYINDILFNCSSSSRYYGNSAKLVCNIQSAANIPLYNIAICFEQECKTIDLAINSEIKQEFKINLTEKKEYFIEIKNFDKKIPLNLNLVDKPNPEIINLNPLILDYKTNNINISLKTNSEANCFLYLNNQEYKIENLISIKDYEIEFFGKNALVGKINAKLTCTDLENQTYLNEKSFEATIQNIPFFARIKLFFINLFNRNR